MTGLLSLVVSIIYVQQTYCVIFEGSCKCDQKEFTNLTFLNFNTPVFQAPLENYQQPFYFFPTENEQTASFFFENTEMFINLRDPTYECKYLNGLRVNNKTQRLEFHVVEKLSRTKIVCIQPTDLIVNILSNNDLVLVWGCVNLLNSSKHDETLLVFLRTTSMSSKFHTELMAPVKSQALKQLHGLSNLSESDLNHIYEAEFSNNHIQWMKEISSRHCNNIQQCPNTLPFNKILKISCLCFLVAIFICYGVYIQ